MKLVGYIIARKRVKEFHNIDFDPDTGLALIVSFGSKIQIPINTASKVLVQYYPKLTAAIIDVENPDNIIKFYTVDHKKVVEGIILNRYKCGKNDMLLVKIGDRAVNINSDLYKIPRMYDFIQSDTLMYIDFEVGSLNKDRKIKQLNLLRAKVKKYENILENLNQAIKICESEEMS